MNNLENWLLMQFTQNKTTNLKIFLRKSNWLKIVIRRFQHSRYFLVTAIHMETDNRPKGQIILVRMNRLLINSKRFYQHIKRYWIKIKFKPINPLQHFLFSPINHRRSTRIFPHLNPTHRKNSLRLHKNFSTQPNKKIFRFKHVNSLFNGCVHMCFGSNQYSDWLGS